MEATSRALQRLESLEYSCRLILLPWSGWRAHAVHLISTIALQIFNTSWVLRFFADAPPPSLKFHEDTVHSLQIVQSLQSRKAEHVTRM